MVESLSEPLKIYSTVGYGSHSTVYKILDARNRTFAAKVTSTRREYPAEQNALREAQILAYCQQPHIVRYIGHGTKKNEFILFTEFCGLGSLQQVMQVLGRALTEREIACILPPLLQALNYLHKIPILHRDIRCGNILLTDAGEVKLADFSCAIAKAKARDLVGTTHWLAPEAVWGEEYDFRADIWSLGVTLLEMAEGSPPYFNLPSPRALFEIRKRVMPYLYKSRHWSISFRSLLRSCLQPKPRDRATAETLLQHSFLRDVSSKDLIEFIETCREKAKFLPVQTVLDAERSHLENLDTHTMRWGKDPFLSSTLHFSTPRNVMQSSTIETPRPMNREKNETKKYAMCSDEENTLTLSRFSPKSNTVFPQESDLDITTRSDLAPGVRIEGKEDGKVGRMGSQSYKDLMNRMSHEEEKIATRLDSYEGEVFNSSDFSLEDISLAALLDPKPLPEVRTDKRTYTITRYHLKEMLQCEGTTFTRDKDLLSLSALAYALLKTYVYLEKGRREDNCSLNVITSEELHEVEKTKRRVKTVLYNMYLA